MMPRVPEACALRTDPCTQRWCVLLFRCREKEKKPLSPLYVNHQDFSTEVGTFVKYLSLPRGVLPCPVGECHPCCHLGLAPGLHLAASGGVGSQATCPPLQPSAARLLRGPAHPEPWMVGPCLCKPSEGGRGACGKS